MLIQPWFAAAIAITSATQVASATQVTSSSPAQLEQRGWQAYKLASFGKAVDLWQQAAQSYLMEHETLGQARVMGSMSLAHQHLGNWEEAKNSLETGRSLLRFSVKGRRSMRPTHPSNPSGLTNSAVQPELVAQPDPVAQPELATQQVFGQLIETEARLYRAMGQIQLEQEHWQEAADLYQKLGQTQAQHRCQLFQIQAQQHLGEHVTALKQLAELQTQIQNAEEQASPGQSHPEQAKFQARIQQQQAIAHWQLGNLNQAQQLLENLLNRAAEQPNIQAQTHLLLGHLYAVQDKPNLAMGAYQQAAQSPTYKIQALESLLHFHLGRPNIQSNPSNTKGSQLKTGTPLSQEADGIKPFELWSQLQQQWKQTPTNQAQLYRRMGVIQHLAQKSLSAEQLSILEALAYEHIQRSYSLGETATITEAMLTLAQVHRAAQDTDKALSLLQEAERNASNHPMLLYRIQSQRAQIRLDVFVNEPKMGEKMNEPRANGQTMDESALPESVFGEAYQANQRLQQWSTESPSSSLTASTEMRSQTSPQKLKEKLEERYRHLLEQLAQPRPQQHRVQAIARQIQALEQGWQLQTAAWRYANLDD